MDDVHVVSSTSAQAAGKNANRARMAAQFKSRPDTIYVRKPVTIEVHAPWNVASERASGRESGRNLTKGQRPLVDSGRAVRADALQGKQVLQSTTMN